MIYSAPHCHIYFVYDYKLCSQNLSLSSLFPIPLLQRTQDLNCSLELWYKFVLRGFRYPPSPSTLQMGDTFLIESFIWDLFILLFFFLPSLSFFYTLHSPSSLLCMTSISITFFFIKKK